MIDLLSKRIINAKKELTNLKTAHTRGLGNVMVYHRTETMTSPNTGYTGYLITIEISFDPNFGAYPFAEVIAGPEVDGTTLYRFLEFEYRNSGRQVAVVAYGIFYNPAVTVSYDIFSLAPVTNVAVTWEEY